MGLAILGANAPPPSLGPEGPGPTGPPWALQGWALQGRANFSEKVKSKEQPRQPSKRLREPTEADQLAEREEVGTPSPTQATALRTKAHMRHGG